MQLQNVEDFYPLSPLQEGLLFHSLSEPRERGMYFNQALITLTGELDVPAFRRAWGRVVDRHAILRTFFAWEGVKEPVQIIQGKVDLPYAFLDLRNTAAEDQQKKIENIRQDDLEQGFNLAKPPLLRMILMQTADNSHEFLWSFHHILMDGWSMFAVLKEVFSLYEAFSQMRDLRLPAIPPYRNYIAWLKRQDMAKAEKFWRESLKGFTAPTPLVVDKNPENGALQGEDFATEPLPLSAEATQALEAMSQKHHLTMNTIVQAAWGLLLSRYSGEPDVVYGSIVSGRPADLPDVEAMVGLFINTLPVRVKTLPQDSVLDWLEKLQTQQAEMREFDFSPLIKVQEWSPEASGRDRSLFDSIFMFENYRKEMPLEKMGGDLEISNVRWFERVNYSLVALAIPGERFMLRVIYHRSRFARATIQRMLGHWRNLLEGIVADPHAKPGDLPMATHEERQQILVDWNTTRTDYPRDECIQQLFEQQAAQTPDAIAVTFSRSIGTGEGQSLTYAALNRRANQLAHFLIEQGVGPETPVGICMERSLEMVIGLLGILKAGGAYVPLDPDYPDERLAFMLADTQMPILISSQQSAFSRQLSAVSRQQSDTNSQQPATSNQQPATSIRFILLDRDWPEIAKESTANPAVPVLPENLASIMYTSGSTGRPKGTTVPHRGVVRLVRETDFASLTADEVLLQFAPVSFDASTLEIWGSLLNGGRLAVFPAHTPSLEELGEMLKKEQVTTLWLTAGLFHQMVEKHLDGLSGVRQLLAGGDVLSVAHIKKAMQELPQCQLINGYGPTENTTFTCCYSFSDENAIGHTAPIGHPIANTQVYIFDSAMQPVPIGIAGDLYTSGDGLARGYLNRPDLTAEKFVPNSEFGEWGVESRGLSVGSGASSSSIIDSPRPTLYSPHPTPHTLLPTPHSELRIYKTGDLAKYRVDGNIEFLGRNDFQVKIRGFRIELGEIETALAQHPAVQDTVVIAREDEPDAKQLVAYVIADDAQEVDVADLRSHLQASLPDYMIPSAFVMLNAFPLNANGKVDRAKLPAPEGKRQVATEFIAPKSEIEQTIASIWQEVLKIDKVGLHDNFFDLGGHSLALIQAHGKLKAALNKDIPMVDLFKYPKVRALAKYLNDESPQQNGAQQAQSRAEKRRAAMQRRRVSSVQ